MFFYSRKLFQTSVFRVVDAFSSKVATMSTSTDFWWVQIFSRNPQNQQGYGCLCRKNANAINKKKNPEMLHLWNVNFEPWSCCGFFFYSSFTLMDSVWRGKKAKRDQNSTRFNKKRIFKKHLIRIKPSFSYLMYSEMFSSSNAAQRFPINTRSWVCGVTFNAARQG